ncbi:MAG TPA: hypothetical protein VJ785_01100 [Anaerolineales bacterium]|nr:hypothetical protein [Anaerolineales bacterium]
MTPKLTTSQRAARLPAPVPGQVLTISLDLLPEYLVLHHLTPMQRSDVRSLELETKIHKPDGVLWVQKIQTKEELQP